MSVCGKKKGVRSEEVEDHVAPGIVVLHLSKAMPEDFRIKLNLLDEVGESVPVPFPVSRSAMFSSVVSNEN